MKFRNYIFIGVGVFVVVMLVAAAVLVKIPLNGKISYGTKVSGVDLSMMMPEDAEKALLKAEKDYMSKKLSITFQGKTEKFLPEELGIKLDPAKTLESAQSASKSEIYLYEFILNKTKNSPVNLTYNYTIDENKALKALDEKFKLSEIAPKSATFYFEKKELLIAPEKEGILINESKILEDLQKSAETLSHANIILVGEKKIPKVKTADLEKKKDILKETLAFEFILEDPIYSDDWEISLIDHLDWVSFVPATKITFGKSGYTMFLDEKKSAELIKTFQLFESVKADKTVTVEINKKPLNDFLDAEVAKWLDRPAQAVKVYKDDKGKIIIEGEGSDGKRIMRDALKKQIEMAVENRTKRIPIPVETIATPLNISQELQDLGIKERLGVGHTSYYGSPTNRVFNIKVGASKFNGLLIKPDEIFSFNDYLGEVDAVNGYREELVIKPEGTIPEYGGGICQVSTTMYRTALFSGLPITERHPHSYIVRYYSQILGHGLDATIYLGGPNLKFKNDTGHNILIQTYTKNDYELYIVFYGTGDGRKVRMEGPYLSNSRSPGPTVTIETTDLAPGQTKQVEKAHTGMDAVWYRYLMDSSGKEIKETIFTKYKAIPAKILVGKAAEETINNPISN